MKQEIIMLREVNQAQKDKGHTFSFMWKIHPKDKHTLKYEHHHK
jgi:hypothetical protein